MTDLKTLNEVRQEFGDADVNAALVMIGEFRDACFSRDDAVAAIRTLRREETDEIKSQAGLALAILAHSLIDYETYSQNERRERLQGVFSETNLAKHQQREPKFPGSLGELWKLEAAVIKAEEELSWLINSQQPACRVLIQVVRAYLADFGIETHNTATT